MRVQFVATVRFLFISSSLAFFLAPYSAFGQTELTEIKGYYDNGNLREIEHYNMSTGKREGEYKRYHDNGHLHENGNYLNGKQEGLWTIYYSDSIGIYRQGTYSAGLEEGLFTTYNEDGSIFLQGHYHQGIKEDKEWIGRNSSGEIVTRFTVKNGVIVGESFFTIPYVGVQYEVYDSLGNELKKSLYNFNNKILDVYVYSAGSVQGIRYSYYEDDSTLFSSQVETNYVSDGECVYYHRNGQILAKGTRKNDLEVGYWEFYFENGQIQKKGAFTADTLYYPICMPDTTSCLDFRDFYYTINPGQDWQYYFQIPANSPEGEWVEFYENGQIKQIVLIKEGRPVGQWLTYHPNGQLRTNSFWINGQIHGEYLIYDETGNLVVKEIYKNGSFVKSKTIK